MTNVESMKMLKSELLKTIKTKLYKNFCKNWVTLYIKTWSQFVNKEHLIDEAVKLAVAFFEDGKIRSEIFRCNELR